MSDQKTQSRPLVFAELPIGAMFIAFPTDGDDAGHGGFRGIQYVFRKTYPACAERVFNTYGGTLGEHRESSFPAGAKVLPVG